MLSPSSQEYASERKPNIDADPLTKLLELIEGRKKLLMIFAFLGTVVGTIDHFYKPSFRSQALLFIHKPDNSAIQGIWSSMLGDNGVPKGLTGVAADGLDVYLVPIHSRDFTIDLSRKMESDSEKNHIASLLSHDRKFFDVYYGKHAVYQMKNFKELTPSEISEIRAQSVARVLANVMLIDRGLGTDTIQVSVDTENSEASVFLANYIAKYVQDWIIERDKTELSSTRKYIDSSILEFDHNLKEGENQILKIRLDHHLSPIDGAQIAEIQKGLQLRAENDARKLRIEQNTQRISYLTKLLKDHEVHFSGAVDEGAGGTASLGALREELEELLKVRSRMQLQGYDEKSWPMQDLKEQIQALQVKLQIGPGRAGEGILSVGEARQTEDEIHALKQENRDLDIEIVVIERKLQEYEKIELILPEVNAKVTELKHSADLYSTILLGLKKRLFEVDLQLMLAKNKVELMEKAAEADIVRKMGLPQKIAICLICSLILGVVTAYILDKMSLAIINRRDLERTGFSVIGYIPREEHPKSNIFVPEEHDPAQVLHDSPFSRAIKRLRMRILNLRDAAGLPAVVVTMVSPGDEEGKSFICSRVALSLAQLGKKTLLIDCDIRKATTSIKFGASTDAGGLSSVLLGEASPDEAIQRNVVPDLDILSAGKYSGLIRELVSGVKLKNLLEKLRSRYDYILIDTPSLFDCIESAAISSVSDVAILTVMSRKTQKEAITRAREYINESGQLNFHVILNSVERNDDYGLRRARIKNLFSLVRRKPGITPSATDNEKKVA